MAWNGKIGNWNVAKDTQSFGTAIAAMDPVTKNGEKARKVVRQEYAELEQNKKVGGGTKLVLNALGPPQTGRDAAFFAATTVIPIPASRGAVVAGRVGTAAAEKTTVSVLSRFGAAVPRTGAAIGKQVGFDAATNIGATGLFGSLSRLFQPAVPRANDAVSAVPPGYDPVAAPPGVAPSVVDPYAPQWTVDPSTGEYAPVIIDTPSPAPSSNYVLPTALLVGAAIIAVAAWPAKAVA